MAAGGLSEFPRHPNSVTPEWLTERLKEGGHLSSGAVTSIAVDMTDNITPSQLARLTIAYDREASHDAPRHLFMKIGKRADSLTEVFPGEATFYAGLPSHQLPIPACHGVFLDDPSGLHCILLEDLSTSHTQTPWPLPPPIPMCEAAVRALARIHGYWWTNTGAEPDVSSVALQANEKRLAAHAQAVVPDFLRDLDDRLSEQRGHVIRTVCDKLPDLKCKRISSGHAFTRVHGDAHFWNVMFPVNSDAHDCVFIDWEMWRYDIAASDLAYMIALHWYPDRRARYERQLLRVYHDALMHDTSIEYDWNDLLADYRLGHLQNITFPLFLQNWEVHPAIWWPHLERWFLAFEDLSCGDLL